jgi:hypothetical protein
MTDEAFLDRCQRFVRGQLNKGERGPTEALDIQVWQAFGGYAAIYGTLPPARTVNRVRLWLAAVSEYQAELQKEQQRLVEEAEREARRNAGRR